MTEERKIYLKNYMKEWRIKNPTYFKTAHYKLKVREYRQKNPELLQRLRDWEKNNKTHCNQYRLNWRKENKSLLSYHNSKRRSLEMDSEGSHTSTEFEVMKIKYGYMCLCCKKSEPEIVLSEDHIVPLSKGGSNYISNIQPLCLSCNSIKSTKTIDYTLIES